MSQLGRTSKRYPRSYSGNEALGYCYNLHTMAPGTTQPLPDRILPKTGSHKRSISPVKDLFCLRLSESTPRYALGESGVLVRNCVNQPGLHPHGVP